uniref:Calponin-homology (CH) domain-containing protein n=1 Tax=Periophthalmus magnuspinnatus TaxID=409849 RepID=A0A3B4AS58_9GOBI
MPATEKDLAEDAPWKKIQQNTFTRWINEHLKCVNKRVADLQLDLGDGLRLVALLEVLSQKKIFSPGVVLVLSWCCPGVVLG